MKDLLYYISEALNLDLAKQYADIKRDPKAQEYLNVFWEKLREYALSHGGFESRNKFRIYLPYTGQPPEVSADDAAQSGSNGQQVRNREFIKDAVEFTLKNKGQWIEKWDYIGGTCDVGMKDQNGNVKVRPNQKIGKLIGGDEKELMDFFANDPVRLGKNILSAIKSNNLWIVISNHSYDIAGMSTNRDWTSCMNVIDGDNKEYVDKDIQYGTLVAYIIDKKDTNINRPYGRVLIKPYKLQRKDYQGFEAAPIVYAPEVTVYSPYIGLRPIRQWLKDICEEIQGGEGMLRSLKQLYNDTFHDKADKEFKGRL